MDATARSRSAVRYDIGDHEDRPWGSWRVVDAGSAFITKRVEVGTGHRLSLQFHRHRSEHWIIVAGRGEATVGETRTKLQPGDHVAIPCGAKHRIHNTGAEPLVFVEVQLGETLDESDITRLDDDYAR
ncbi:phosphomannose isomerase type II C-terminal cupin domain [Pelagibius marinus]|uniref:phosphomannose isomerase type II C-terminal cupin domain n=1 Tax=Pelagibius marinus TaxID=2762760 RepID=UPI00187335AE|nr:phosphomannose isomerase type II C-terminal cupin domain [Pelagibius marinus]